MSQDTMSDLIERYLSFREVSKGRSVQTSVKYRLYLSRLVEFCKQLDVDPLRVSPEQLDVFTGVYVFKQMAMGPHARRAVVAAVKGLYAWLRRGGLIEHDPAVNLEYPKAPRKLPVAMQIDAAERLMWAPDLTEFTGIRDAAILGLLIGCGFRATGLMRLNVSSLVWSVDNGQELLSIRVFEKGDKERMVPVPDQARLLLRAYLGHEHLESVDRRISETDEVLFISTCNRRVPASELYGENLRLQYGSIYNLVLKHGEKAGIPREYLHPHSLRHLLGAELTEDDVDVLDRMAIMGHSDVKSAEIYSHIAQRKLRRIMDKSSPLSKIRTPVSDLAKILQRTKQ